MVCLAAGSACLVIHRILLASIKCLGRCPCPHCLVKKADVPNMGMKSDLRRRDKLQCIDDHSRCHNIARDSYLEWFCPAVCCGSSADCTSVKLVLEGNFYSPCMPTAGNSVQDLNERYRMVLTFGCGTIQHYHSNASSMNKLAARDFEDLLQCALPVFEDLLPKEHDSTILAL